MMNFSSYEVIIIRVNKSSFSGIPSSFCYINNKGVPKHFLVAFTNIKLKNILN